MPPVDEIAKCLLSLKQNVRMKCNGILQLDPLRERVRSFSEKGRNTDGLFGHVVRS